MPKISALTAAVDVTGDETVVMVQDGQTVRGPVSALVSAAVAPALAVADASALDAANSADIASAAALASGTYADVEAGLTATASGQTFWTRNPANLYLNYDGEAVLQDELATLGRSLGVFNTDLIDNNSTTKQAFLQIAQRLAAAAGSGKIGFLAAGLSAKERTSEEKHKDFISVKDHGAIGDGIERPVSQWIVPGALARFANFAALQLKYPHVTATTQSIDWAAIQGAYNEAGTRIVEDSLIESIYDPYKGGANVYIPAGKYCTTDTIEMPFGVSTDGDGPVSSVIYSTSTFQIIRNKAESFGFGTYGKFGGTISNIGIVGDRVSILQDGLALLRYTGVVDNVWINKCGGWALAVYQGLISQFMNVRGTLCVVGGMYRGGGFDDWDDMVGTANELPTNACNTYGCHFAENDGPGLLDGEFSNGNNDYGITLEYAYKAAGDNEGHNYESRSRNYFPNRKFGMWNEGPCKSHVLCANPGGISATIEISGWNHAAGLAGSNNVDRALIVQSGTVRVHNPVGLGVAYKTINGSTAPFRVADLTHGRMIIIDPEGSEVSNPLGHIEGPDGTLSGCINNIFLRAYGVTYGVLRNYGDASGVTAEEWYAVGATPESQPIVRFEPFWRAIAIGPGGTTAPDVMLKRTAVRTLGLDTRGGTQHIDLGSNWNGNHAKLGGFHLWADAAGRLRIKFGAPTFETDGEVIGTQS